METNKNLKEEENKINIINALKNFIANSGIIGMNELFSKGEKYYHFIYAYADTIIKLYMNHYNKKIYIIQRRKILYLLKSFLNNKKEKKYKPKLEKDKLSDILFIFIIEFSFIIYKNVIKCKDSKEMLIQNKYEKLALYNKFFSKFIFIVGKLYLSQMIKEEHFESFLKFLIILSLGKYNNEAPNKNDNISNAMFLVQCIKIIKMIFNKIYIFKKSFNESQEALMKNVLIFLKDNIIEYSDQKPKNIINKFFLSHNDWFTTSLIDLIFIIVKMKDTLIYDNFIELLSNIYIFSFGYENMMSQLIKLMEPLLMNLNKKKKEEIDSEINIIKFIFDFINELIKREEKLFKEEPLLRDGFFLGNKFCGIFSELDNLEDDFVIIVGFCLCEKYNKTNDIKEWTLINLRTKENKDKDKPSQIRIWLSKINNSDEQYKLKISVKNEEFDTKIIIKSKKTYIFAFNFFKNKKVKISYCDKNEEKINKSEEIQLSKYNADNTNIYIGCDIYNKINLVNEANTFLGYIGTVIILNKKKLSKKGDDIIDIILKLKGDYASSILMSLGDIEYKVTLINDVKKYYYRKNEIYEEVLNKIIECNENAASMKFVESIKAVISPNCFKLIQYKDEIDYLNFYNNYKAYEEAKRNDVQVRQNYLDLKQKTSYSKGEKIVKIFSPFFNSKFNIFKNNYALEEFIKYDGIYFLCLILEYYYQIICNIEKQTNIITADILDKIGKNIIILIEFFINKILNEYSLLNFIKQIKKFFYQMTITLKKYIYINNINSEMWDLIDKLIMKITDILKSEKINSNKNFIEEKIKLKKKFLGLLHDILVSFCYFPDSIYETTENYINIITKLLINEKLDDIYSNHLFDEFLSLSSLFDEKNSRFIGNKEKLIHVQNNYENFLIKLLNNTVLINENSYNKIKTIEEHSTKNFFDKPKKTKTIEDNSKEENSNKDNSYLSHFVEFTLQITNFPYIFSRLLNILYKSNLVKEIKPIYIEHIQNTLLKNYTSDNKENKLISESCLKILLIYSLTNKEEEKKLHNFLKKLSFYKGFFNSVIASLRHITILDSDKLKKSKTKINESNIENDNNISNKNNELYPLLEIDLNKLNKRQKETLIKLFQDCISMLFSENTIKIDENINQKDSKDIYDTLKKNFDKIFEYPGKSLFINLFSSESQITPELFYFKWKKSDKDDRDNLLKDISHYHDKLLLNHGFPFIFRFILLLDLDEENSKEDYIIQLLSFLEKEFEKYFELHNKKIKKEEKETFYFINNLVNFLVLINKLFFKENSLYLENENFRNIFFKLIELLQNTGLLYSNYCFVINENGGKLISEICYDIYLNILNSEEYFEKYKEKFADIFSISNEKESETYSIFYLIDLNREEVLRKEKEIKKELSHYIKEYSNLKIIQEYFFNPVACGNIMLVFGKQINKLEEVNLTIYFLAKTFIYWKELGSKNLKLLISYYLPVISSNLYDLYTKRILFYGHKICNRFLLYKETKEFFESHAIQSGNDFEIYKKFFERDIPLKLKGNDKIEYCYASRMLDKKIYDNINNNVEDDQSNKNMEESNSVLPLENKSSINVSKENLYFFSFDQLQRENLILNPKNYFMKIIFSSIFKDIFFIDEIFKKIKKSYICTYQNKIGLNVRTKQLDFPSREKNFSNFLEPKSFLRRDYKFYKNNFFRVSHEYIKAGLINDRDDDKLFFYKHDLITDIKKENIFESELITNQLLYFGKFCINQDYIFFQSEIDPRENNPKLRKSIYSQYIFSTKDIDNQTHKEKRLLIFIKDIKEIIKRRTLLMRQSIEIFNKSGKSFFFNFFKIEKCEEVCKVLINKCKCYIEEGSKEKINKIITSFKKGDISNYEYLLHLNKLATRTFNDLSQYPVFPWLVMDMTQLISENRTSNEKKAEHINEEDGKESNLRNMNYPISMQNPKKRVVEIEKFKDDLGSCNYPYHLGTHYSTSSYIFYYLMRNNPYCQNMIKLQNYRQENPNRMFLSFKDTQKILKSSTDNRELIPDIYCYVDFYCNVNCALFGLRANNILVDDFSIAEQYSNDNNKYNNIISDYVECLYVNKKLLNDFNTSKGISQWVDIIFGKKQLPTDDEEKAESCNIFGKNTYEQNVKLEDKLNRFIERFKKDPTQEKNLLSKIQNRINIINNFGICPCQILNESYFYEGNNTINPQKKSKKDILFKSENYFYFSKSNGKYFDIFQNSKENPPVKRVQLWDNIESRENIYICGNFESELSTFDKKSEFSKYLYKPNYVISLITLINHHNNPEIFILTCRYFGNYFKIQNLEKEIKVLCEDFVTTVASRNSKKNDDIFYTGLKNGKLVKWKLIILSYESLNIKKKKSKSSLFTIEEKKHIYDHKSSITAIEINNKKNIIVTSGEDKFIHIRKLYDFEILTVINLIYCFGNPIISKSQNIFPSLIKISDLNCIYVLMYDFDKNINIIRGYTLNGLFFAQTSIDEREDLFYNNIIINKNGNLIVGLYNQNKILELNCYNLKVKNEKIFQKKGKSEHLGTKWIEYDDTNNSFIILFDDECQFNIINDETSRNIINS